MVNLQLRAGLGCQTFSVLAQTVFQLLFAGGIAEVCRRSADVVDVSFKVWVVGHLLRFVQDGLLAAGNHLSALMEGDGTEVAVAKAATVLDDGKFHLFDSIHSAHRLIGRVIGAGEGQAEHLVQFFAGEGRHRRVLHQIQGVGLFLNDGLAVDGVLPFGLNLVSFCIAFFVFGNLVEGGTADAVLWDFFLTAQVTAAAQVTNGFQCFSLAQALGQLSDDLFPHAVQQQVCLRIQ